MRFMMLMIPKGYETAAPGTMPDAKAVAAMIAARAAALPKRHVLFMANPLIRLLVAQGCAGVQNGDEKMHPQGRC